MSEPPTIASPAHAAERRPGLNQQSILWVDDISVSFDGFKALTNLTLVLDPGELRCIIGPNGAGKTTMMDVITGKTRPDSGHVYMFGQTVELTNRSEAEIAMLGVGRQFKARPCSRTDSVTEHRARVQGERACQG